MESPGFAGRLAQATLRALDGLPVCTLRAEDLPRHQRAGRRGREDAYFSLRRRLYTIIARNFHFPNPRGELDRVGWERGVLCFIEVKTRTSHDFKSADPAVDRDQPRGGSLVARDGLRPMSPSRQWRFDVLAVYYEQAYRHPAFELFQNAFPVSYNRGFRKRY